MKIKNRIEKLENRLLETKPRRIRVVWADDDIPDGENVIQLLWPEAEDSRKTS